MWHRIIEYITVGAVGGPNRNSGLRRKMLVWFADYSGFGGCFSGSTSRKNRQDPFGRLPAV